MTTSSLSSRLRTLGLLFLLALVAPSAVRAQVRSTPTIAAEGAQRAIAAALAEARAQGWNVSVAVVDPSGELLAFIRMDNAPYSSVDIASGKARTAARFRRPTKSLDSALTAGRMAILGFKGMTPVEGAVPVIIAGQTVGAVGVSGATSAQDAQVAAAGARAIQP
jgi:glc operon protein GlcG